MSNLKQPIPPIVMPMVDSTGAPTPAWIAFFANMQARTGGAAGPSEPYTGSTTDPATAAAVAALQASVTTINAQIVTVTATATDAKTLALLADDFTAKSDEQAALLSEALAD